MLRLRLRQGPGPAGQGGRVRHGRGQEFSAVSRLKAHRQKIRLFPITFLFLGSLFFSVFLIHREWLCCNNNAKIFVIMNWRIGEAVAACFISHARRK